MARVRVSRGESLVARDLGDRVEGNEQSVLRVVVWLWRWRCGGGGGF